jgi:hypothetical protein
MRGLDRYRDRVVWAVTCTGEYVEQLDEPIEVATDAAFDHKLTGNVDQSYVVVWSAWSAVPGLLPVRFSMPPSRVK